MGTGERHVPRLGSWRSKVPAWLRHGVVILLLLLIVEYLVIPELVGAKKDLHLLNQLNVGWLAAGIVLEAASLWSFLAALGHIVDPVELFAASASPTCSAPSR